MQPFEHKFAIPTPDSPKIDTSFPVPSTVYEHHEPMHGLDPKRFYLETLKYEQQVGLNRGLMVFNSNAGSVEALSLTTIDRLVQYFGFWYMVDGVGTYPYFIYLFEDDAHNQLMLEMEIVTTEVRVNLKEKSTNNKLTSIPPAYKISEKPERFRTSVFRAIMSIYEYGSGAMIDFDIGDVVSRIKETKIGMQRFEEFVAKQLWLTSYRT